MTMNTNTTMTEKALPENAAASADAVSPETVPAGAVSAAAAPARDAVHYSEEQFRKLLDAEPYFREELDVWDLDDFTSEMALQGLQSLSDVMTENSGTVDTTFDVLGEALEKLADGTAEDTPEFMEQVMDSYADGMRGIREDASFEGGLRAILDTCNQEIRFINFANRILEEFNCPREGSELPLYNLEELRRDAGDPDKAAAMYEAMEDIFKIADKERCLREPDLFIRNYLSGKVSEYNDVLLRLHDELLRFTPDPE